MGAGAGAGAGARGEGRVWRILGGVMLALAVLAGGVFAWAQLARQSDTDQHTYWQTIRTVEVDSSSGTVRVEAGAPDRVIVRNTLEWSVRRPVVSQSVTRDGVLRLAVGCRVTGCGVSVDVQVPAATEVHVQTSSGRVVVRGVSGKVMLSAISGELALDGVSGEVAAKVRSGQVRGTELASPNVKTTTGSGKVQLSFARPPASVTVSSSSGSVAVAVPTKDAHYRVTGGTTSGSWSVDPEVPDSTADRTVDVSTTSGDVTITSRSSSAPATAASPAGSPSQAAPAAPTSPAGPPSPAAPATAPGGGQ